MNIQLAQTWRPELIPDLPTDSPASALPPAEFAEFVDFPPIDWQIPAANAPCRLGHFRQEAVLPAESILADWFDFASTQTEGADCYLAGSIIPVVGALLGRRCWTHLGGMCKYPNIFALICGKPGDRKSTTIRLAAALARHCLEGKAFLPANFSPESLFDEYDEHRGGQPDKFWIVDDANAVLTDWQKTNHGERNAARFLELYDCAQLSESFRRNKAEAQDGEARRIIPETSTSIIFGATFNVACFQGQTVRAGMARRFLYYVAERRGRDIYESVRPDPAFVQAQIEAFRRCLEIGGEMKLTPEARQRWLDYQDENRTEMNEADPLAEDLHSRLASAPAQVLAVAMIFEAAMWAKRRYLWQTSLTLEALEGAIAHVAASLEAARWLDGIAHRASIAEDAEVILARIAGDFALQRRGDTVYVGRGDLTRAYCNSGSRRAGLRPNDLYHRLIPSLIAQNKARLALKEGKREVFAFRVEE